MSYLYECECDTCKPDFLKLSVSQSIIEQLKKVVLNAYKTLVSKQSYQSNDLSNTQAYKDVINETNSIFQNALKEGVKDNVIPAILQQALKSDIFVFSALKTHAQLFEASQLLKDDTGKIKPFNQFLNDIQSTFKNYNELYLESEYQFAVGSSLMNVKWNEFENNTDRYNLQYRTAGDEKVRASHAELDMITLPQNDPFWNLYFPPNGWRCRCSVSEVLKSKYPQDNSADAIAKGEKATTQIGKDGKNRLEIFRFNTGKQKVIFPPNHPYRKLQGAEGVVKTFDKGLLNQQRNEIKQWAKENLIGKTMAHSKIDKSIQFSMTGIKEALNQPHKYIFEKNQAVKNIKDLISKSKYVKSSNDVKGRNFKYHYLRTLVNNEESFIVIKEDLNTNNNYFYGIVDKLKE